MANPLGEGEIVQALRAMDAAEFALFLEGVGARLAELRAERSQDGDAGVANEQARARDR